MKRRQNFQKRKEKKLKRNYLAVYIILILIVILLIVIAFPILANKQAGKFGYLNKLEDNGAEVVIVDSPQSKIIKIYVPAELELEASQNYGNYRLKSLWQLAKAEGIGGELITQTFVKNLGMPIYLWKDGRKTNMNLFQIFKSWQIDNNFLSDDIQEIHLTKTRFLNNQKMADGKDGFIIKDKPDASVLVYFNDLNQVEDRFVFEINDLTGTTNTAKNVTEMAESMGLKLNNYSKGLDKNLDCNISSNDKELADIFSKILNCPINLTNSQNQSKYLKLELGAIFAERF